jgi:protein O-GlcNAc transferase
VKWSASHGGAVGLDPANVRAHSNWLVALHYATDYPREQLAALARVWGVRHAQPLSSARAPHTNRVDTNRRLRVGYVSGELYRHPVSYFFEALLEAHDRSQVEVTCYSNSRRSDQVTERLAALADRWRSLIDLDDAQAADLIRADGIDILVDLSGHLGNHRLLVFARKPAPVQATWMGYFDTTGVGAIDYLIGDRVVCPQAEDHLYVERVIRLPDCYLCYRPPAFAPAVTALPASSTGRIVFGSFNRLAKTNPRVLATWAELLRALPDSQLVMKGTDVNDPHVVTRLRRFFNDRGIASQRLLLLGPSPQAEFLAAYGGVDIALDTFPYSGSTTSAEALWMGIPVVTLRGDRFVARTTETILRAVGLNELVAESETDYIRRTLALAADRDRLAQLRAGLRHRMSTSTLCNGAAFAQAMEAAYRDMWRAWCMAQ